ncbi:MAG: sn-glycerol-1-phosphate dehydrogenase [Candidatus Izemoplasmatales bacterium]|nr:sn-glycerol-1-phosphate dehydrogenase [Candidatus Izemoplasmatales bacterium]MDD5293444.1 sn-glycerol-1-phosphate dehydrogenase [Candidatus Izemoplasmatales bacterium]
MAHYKVNRQPFHTFIDQCTYKRIFVFGDLNTLNKAAPLTERLAAKGVEVTLYLMNQNEIVPTMEWAEELIHRALQAEYILGVGSGSINDLGKHIAHELGLPYGIFATAPSMDGYLSKGAALICQGVKTTFFVKPPDDMLMDLEVLRQAPKTMIAAGAGDLLGKYTALADWRLSEAINGEVVDEEAYQMMRIAMQQAFVTYDLIVKRDSYGISTLMDALNTAGLAMAKCGHSRPASGSEHHLSHYLEMDFIAHNQPIPLHGLKVGLGTLVALDLYHHLDCEWFDEGIRDQITHIIRDLPSVAHVETLLSRVGAPVRFRELGISKPLLSTALTQAHTIRDRYTILTYYHQNQRLAPLLSHLIERYY